MGEPSIDPLLIITRTLHYAATALLEGTFIFWCFIARPALRRAEASAALEMRIDRRLLVLAWAALAIALATGVGWLIVVASHMSDVPFAAVLPSGVVGIVVTKTQFGHVWALRGALVILLAACLAAQRGGVKQPTRWIGLAIAAALVVSLAWAGHGAAADLVPFDFLHLPADLLHLLAAGAWLGALAPLGVLLIQARRDGRLEAVAAARAATLRFSILGITCVATLLATGLVNTWFLSGSIPALVGTLYGRLLLLKVALFAAMVAIASVNLNRLTPQLESSGESSLRLRAIRQLGRNALGEASLGLCVLAIVGIIGTLPPGLHTEPNWPFPFRIDLAEITLGAQKVLNAAAFVFFVCLAAGAITAARKRYRGMVVAAAGVVIFGGVGWGALRPGIVRAYPTSYYASTQPYAAPSVARGAPLYFANCTACHGASGRGDGPLAARLPIRPADLTAEHIFAHSAGDIFWWVSDGYGKGVMPGFSGALSPDQRWDLINFVLARAAGIQTNSVGSQITTAAAPPLPDFAFEEHGAQNTLHQTLKIGPVLLVFFGSPAPRARLDQLAALQPQLTSAGLRVIAVRLGSAAKNPASGATSHLPFVVNVSDDVRETLALFRSPADGGESELMLDRNGAVRARWTAGGSAGLADSATLLADSVRVASIPAAAANHAGHGG